MAAKDSGAASTDERCDSLVAISTEWPRLRSSAPRPRTGCRSPREPIVANRIRIQRVVSLTRRFSAKGELAFYEREGITQGAKASLQMSKVHYQGSKTTGGP